jgi:hypothetical protein
MGYCKQIDTLLGDVEHHPEEMREEKMDEWELDEDIREKISDWQRRREEKAVSQGTGKEH